MITWFTGDVFDGLATLEDNSVDLVVTSPPFLALRSYLPADHPDKGKEIGSEATPAEFLDVMLQVTAELRRVLAPHGSIAVELGDTYAGSGGAGGDYDEDGLREGQPMFRANPGRNSGTRYQKPGMPSIPARERQDDLAKGGDGWPLAKSKTLIPELYRIALAYGFNPLTGESSPAGRWRVRNVVTWCRPNPPVGALGDKWRPATSDIVVACVSDKRYWDDLATRRPSVAPDQVERPRHTRSTEGREEFWDEGHGRFGIHPSGAPLLDYWEIPPGGYAGAHYAVYPPALVEPLVKAMCPEKVCRTCGEPSRRIVSDPIYVNGDGEVVAPEVWQSGVAEGFGAHTHKRTSATRQDSTLGFTDCGHGSIVCRSCNGLVPYDHAIRRPRQGAQLQSGVGEEEILGEPVEGAIGEQEASEGVRDLRGGLPWAVRDDENLQPVLFGAVGPPGGKGEPDRRTGLSQPDMEGRTQGTSRKAREGLHSDLGAAGLSGPTKERLHDGTPSGDAGASGQGARSVRVGTPPERRLDGQPDRELGDSEPHEASRDGDLPELRDGVPHPLDGYVCPCGSTDFKYVADHWRPGRVLDPFAGSGTTLAVASGHGHDTIGIDLDPRNEELARERVGPLLWQDA